MMILDAISSAKNEHAVYFLVTAYLESLQHFPRGLGLPKSVMKLPVGGIDDLEQRLTSLQHDSNIVLDTVVPAWEVSAVLSSAVQRLSSRAAHAAEKR
jgi:hypothetical protein